MIFVTVGTHPQSFNRLLKTVDELIGKGVIEEEVVIQIGHSTYEPKNARWFRFTDYKEIEELNKNARLIITHGGAGCILTALSFGRPTIAIPRLKRFGEHIDDHQLDLVNILSKENKINAVFDLEKLEYVIKTKRTTKLKTKENSLAKEIRRYLKSL